MKLNGYNICIAKPFQRMQLSAKVPVTPEFRADINAWMAGFFGYDCLLKNGEVLVSELTRTMFVTQDDYNRLRNIDSNKSGISQRLPMTK